MNSAGKRFVEDCEKRWKRLVSLLRDAGRKIPEFTDSSVNERIMRLGRECRDYGVDPFDSWEIRNLALATLKEGYCDKLLHDA